MASILSDEMVRSLVAAGQVDVLVGIPSLDNAETIGHVVRQVHVAFAKHFPRERTLMLNADGGSTDGTRDVVRSASPDDTESVITSHALRTTHRISVPYHGLQGKASALRTILTVGDLLQARVVVVIDPDATAMTPEWVQSLVVPVLRGNADFVTPRYARHALEGPLVTQLVRPLVRAAYGWKLQEPLAAEFASSSRYVSHVTQCDVWDKDGVGEGIDLWMSLEALVREYRCVEVPLDQHAHGARRVRPALPEAFSQVFGTLLACLEWHDAYWLGRQGSSPLTLLGGEPPAHPEAPAFQVESLAESYRRGVRELAPILSSILSDNLFAEARSHVGETGVPGMPDALWARMVYAFALADRRRSLPRQHLAQALVPLYQGRTAAFLERNASRAPAEIEASLEALSLEYERLKPDFVTNWQANGRR